jgi:hypothetical protein
MTAENSRGNAADLFADTPYDAATLATMIEAYAAACHELETLGGGARLRFGNELRLIFVARILKAVAAGERDPERITLLALRAIDHHLPPRIHRHPRRR